MTRIALRPTRFGTALAAILLSTLLAAPVTSTAQKKNQSGGDTYSEIAQAFVASLKKERIKNVVISDFTGPDGQVTPFGSWLADRLSFAGSWAPVDVLDRKKFATELTGLRSADANDFDWAKIQSLSMAQDTAVLLGSYAPAEGGIGVTLTSAAWRKVRLAPTVIRAKIELTSEMQAHLPGGIESLAPPNGIYTEAQGGLSPCDCDNQQFNIQRTHPGVEKGEASFSMVIQPDGKITDLSQCKSSGTLTGDLCRDLLDAPKTFGWACKPAKNIDGRPVPARKYIHVSYTCGDNGRNLCYVYSQKMQ
jgi:hypothetical protein